MSSIPDDHLLRAMLDWSSEARLAEAAADRSARNWQRQIAAEELRMQAILQSVCGTSEEITIHGLHERVHRGTVAAVEADYCLLITRDSTVMVSLDAVGSVLLARAWRSVTMASETPGVTSRPSMADSLSALVEHRPYLVITTKQSRTTRSGALVAVGNDVLLLDQPGETRSTSVIALDQIADVAF